jgi:hypothetical protein
MKRKLLATSFASMFVLASVMVGPATARGGGGGGGHCCGGGGMMGVSGFAGASSITSVNATSPVGCRNNTGGSRCRGMASSRRNPQMAWPRE